MLGKKSTKNNLTFGVEADPHSLDYLDIWRERVTKLEQEIMGFF